MEFILVFGIIGGIYFLPTIVANLRKNHNIAAVFILNLFLGWTFFGWVMAFVWAVTKDSNR